MGNQKRILEHGRNGQSSMHVRLSVLKISIAPVMNFELKDKSKTLKIQQNSKVGSFGDLLTERDLVN